MSVRDKRAEPQVRIADLVADGGSASRAHDLIQAVYDSVPPDLSRAQALPHYARLRQQKIREHGEENVNMPAAPILDLDAVARHAGLEKGAVADASVKGRSLDDAWVVYVAYDAQGAPFHGCYEYGEHKGTAKAKSHTSVAEAFAESEIGRRMVAQRKASQGHQGAAADDDDAVVDTGD